MGFRTGYIGHIGTMAAAMALIVGNIQPEEPQREVNATGFGWGDIPRRHPRSWRFMEEPHNFPPNPFESRQVRRARERRLAKKK